MSLPDIYTIGVYGLTEADFFQKLLDSNIDTFCDIRRRRAVRGSQYAFVNSKRLQDKLEKLSIRYVYENRVSTNKMKIRELQKIRQDKNKNSKKRQKETN